MKNEKFYQIIRDIYELSGGRYNEQYEKIVELLAEYIYTKDEMLENLGEMLKDYIVLQKSER